MIIVNCSESWPSSRYNGLYDGGESCTSSTVFFIVDGNKDEIYLKLHYVQFHRHVIQFPSENLFASLLSTFCGGK